MKLARNHVKSVPENCSQKKITVSPKYLQPGKENKEKHDAYSPGTKQEKKGKGIEKASSVFNVSTSISRAVITEEYGVRWFAAVQLRGNKFFFPPGAYILRRRSVGNVAAEDKRPALSKAAPVFRSGESQALENAPLIISKRFNGRDL